MRSLVMLAAVAALSLSGCMGATSAAPPATVSTAAGIADAAGAPAPVELADRTTIDETAGIGFETAVTVAADLATLAVRAKAVLTSSLPELRERVAWARVAVGAVRAAYDTGNASSYRAAVASATCAIARVQSLATGQVDKPCANTGKVVR